MTESVRLLTPPGRGGVAVLRVEGRAALERLARLLTRLPEPGQLAVLPLRDGALALDETVVVRESAERCELHLSGSPPLVRAVIELLGGELPKSAQSFEERALERLAAAESEAGARILLDQAEGALRRALLLHQDDSRDEWRDFVLELLEAARIAEPALLPRRVALAGAVNAGKSTLFNLLVGSERVIVSDEPGTTRDAVHARVRLGSWPIVLIDTAGERELSDREDPAGRERLERAGQASGRRERESADLVLWLRAAGSVEASEPRREALARPNTIELTSRAGELDGSGSLGGRSLASLEQPEATRALVEAVFLEHFDLPTSGWRAGAAVPFEPELRELLLRSLEVESGDALELRRDVLAALDSPPVPAY